MASKCRKGTAACLIQITFVPMHKSQIIHRHTKGCVAVVHFKLEGEKDFPDMTFDNVNEKELLPNPLLTLCGVYCKFNNKYVLYMEVTHSI